MTVLIDDGHGGVRAAEPTVAERLHARLYARRMDRELANGAAVEQDIAHALHAHRLTGMRERRRLADGLLHATAAAARPHGISATVLDLAAVAAARPELLELRERLLAPGPVSVRGVAATRCLLINGTGPMYGSAHGRPLAGALRHVTELLELRPVHAR